MGGGGGGHSFSAERLKKLEATAKKLIQDAEPGRRNVFISFASEDENEVNLLRGQAKNDVSGLEFNDWSLKEPFDSKNAEYIKRGIRERIRQASVTICFISDSTAQSKWVDWEMRESAALGKGVIGMYKGGSPPVNLPQAVRDLKIKLVPWNHESLSNAIKSA